MLIHCVSTVCWGCQNSLNHNFLEKENGGRVTMAGRSEIMSQIPRERMKITEEYRFGHCDCNLSAF